MIMRLLLDGATLLLLLLSSSVNGFTTSVKLPSTFRNASPSLPFQQQHHHVSSTPPLQYSTHSNTNTRLYALLDVPDNFFTVLLPTLSLFLAFSKAVARSRLEERAWEQRLEESRELLLEKDSSLTEFDLRRKEAAAEWSAYGNGGSGGDEGEETQRRRRNTRQRRVMTREQTLDEEETTRREFTMTPDEIQNFTNEFGVEYDPYYDDPYTEDELPEDIPFKVDKLYGDRIYKNGEVFYKDATSGLYYRQGSQPRIQKFW